MLVFGKRFERFERVIPESVEIGAYAFDPGRVQLVDTPVSDRPVKDQIGVLEHLLKQRTFASTWRSRTIESIRRKTY